MPFALLANVRHQCDYICSVYFKKSTACCLNFVKGFLRTMSSYQLYEPHSVSSRLYLYRFQSSRVLRLTGLLKRLTSSPRPVWSKDLVALKMAKLKRHRRIIVALSHLNAGPALCLDRLLAIFKYNVIIRLEQSANLSHSLMLAASVRRGDGGGEIDPETFIA